MRDNTEKPFSKAEVDAIRRSFGDETRLFSEFWALIRRIGRSIPFAEDIVAAYFCAIDPSTSPRAKVILIGAILYFVMPIDAIPDVLPIIGFTDDAAVLAAAIAAVKPWITELHRKKAREALAENA